MAKSFERKKNIALPEEYLSLLKRVNGGTFRKEVTIPAGGQMAEIEGIKGIGGTWGIDSEELGSDYLIEEWGYPDIGIVIGIMVSGGGDALMLDYREDHQKPAVCYVDDDSKIHVVAENFHKFLEIVKECFDQ